MIVYMLNSCRLLCYITLAVVSVNSYQLVNGLGPCPLSGRRGFWNEKYFFPQALSNDIRYRLSFFFRDFMLGFLHRYEWIKLALLIILTYRSPIAVKKENEHLD